MKQESRRNRTPRQLIWGVELGILVASISLGCMAEIPGVNGVEAMPATTTTAPVRVAEVSTIRFAMNKWMDPEGTVKGAVEGAFTGIKIEVDEVNRGRMRRDDLADVKVKMVVDLATLDTGMEGRDFNIKAAFFEVAAHPTAVVTVADLRRSDDPDIYQASVSLSLHGMQKELASVPISVQRVAGGYRVQTLSPLAIAAADFELPVQALLELCGHPGLDETAEVEADVFIPYE